MDFEYFLFLCKHQGELKMQYIQQRKQKKKEYNIAGWKTRWIKY